MQGVNLEGYSRVIIKRVILQNNLHIKLDYHYVYLAKDFFSSYLSFFSIHSPAVIFVTKI